MYTTESGLKYKILRVKPYCGFPPEFWHNADFPMGLTAINGTKSKWVTIMVSVGWNNTPEEAAILAHEIGHIECGHLVSSRAHFVDTEEELVADAYANARGHGKTLLRILEKILAVTETTIKENSHPEHNTILTQEVERIKIRITKLSQS